MNIRIKSNDEFLSVILRCRNRDSKAEKVKLEEMLTEERKAYSGHEKLNENRIDYNCLSSPTFNTEYKIIQISP